MKVYNTFWKERIVRYYKKSKKSLREVGKIFSVGKSSISRWLKSEKVVKETKKDNLEEMIGKIIGENWVGRVKDIQEILERDYGLVKSISTIWRRVENKGYSYKQVRKKVEMDKNSIEKKEEYKSEINKIGYEKVLCFDEVGFQLGMDPKKGWSKKGTRCVIKNKKGGRENYSGCFLISREGIVNWEVKKGSIKKEDMVGFLDRTGKLEKLEKKVLVLDNARTHHTEDVKKKLEELGVEGRWLPPYSPELNPIEEMFSMLKRRLRYMRIRTEKELREGIRKVVSEINRKGLLGMFRHSYE